MSLLRQLSESLSKNRDEEAREIALKIEASDYPNSLKKVAQKALRELGRQHVKPLDSFSELLYQIATTSATTQNEAVPSWFPWRIILDSYGAQNDECKMPRAPRAALKNYTQAYLAKGINTLSYLHKVNRETIRRAIAPFFDPEYYKESHLDIRGATNDDALYHYLCAGGSEPDRKPNHLFSNKDLFQNYYWAKKLNFNALYLFVRWPEQFADIQRLIAKRYLLLKNEIALPWPRPIAQTSNQIHNSSDTDYKRIVGLTKEHSSKNKLIATNLGELNIHIVIPDFTKGGGGHMTIFRMITHLEKAGHRCTIWIKGYSNSRHPEGPRMSATKDYQPIKAQVLPLSSHFAFARGDALIATSWDTVEIVRENKSFHDYFYLVQDYEPYFFPRGSESLEAEFTYGANLKTICASSWLDEIMRTKFSRRSTYFSLSFNSSVYHKEARSSRSEGNSHVNYQVTEGMGPPTGNQSVVRIAFYARSRTARRAVTLALKGIEKTRQDGYTLCVELFGEERGKINLPSNVVGHDNGILSPNELAELYRSCDIGLTFSATNYALVPQEMMACGLPVIEIDNDSTRSIYPQGILVLADPSAQGIADAIDDLATDQAKREEIAAEGLRWVQQTSWDKSFQEVETFIRNEVEESSLMHACAGSMPEHYLSAQMQILRQSDAKNSIVSVVIPTYQGGSLLQEVVAKVQNQSLENPFEVIIIDSSSTDGVIEDLSYFPNTTVIRIDKQIFQHGRTRNLGAALASSPYVAFLTQDAVPVSNKWLANLIRPLQDNQDVVAVFGRHRSHPSHSNHLNEAMKTHFEAFQAKKLYHKSDDLIRYYQDDPAQRQFLHFYSDNNSCLRKSFWMSYPYPDVFYGEDQLWADWVIQSDGTKAYADDAVVFHSHDYTEQEEYDRARTEAYFFMKYFGYQLGQDRLESEVSIETDATALLRSESVSIKPIREHLLRLLRAKREGYNDGYCDAQEWLSSQ